MFIKILNCISRAASTGFRRQKRGKKIGKRSLLLENLDVRYAMAGDLMSMAEGEAAPDLVAFAKALKVGGLKLYGADWTQETTDQLKAFDDGARYLDYFEAFNGDRTQNSIGVAQNITAVPTWIDSTGGRAPRPFTPQELAAVVGIPIPTSSTPSFFPIEPQTALQGSPLHIPIDAYDPNGNPLTFTVTSSSPTNVKADILENNQSARITVDGYGEMVFELFNTDAPRPVNRFVTLAQSGFYNTIDATATTPAYNMTFHRAGRDQLGNPFVIQGGDPLGTGTGGSTLPDFDDQFSLNLQHNRTGILSYAKSLDDTNDSQFFVTAGPTRFLDYNHSVFGQLIEGDMTRAGINRIAIDGNERPLAPVVIRKVEIFNDTENGLLRLTPLGAAGSTSEITVIVRDNEGNQFSQSFTVTVAADTSNGAPFFGDIPVGKGTTNAPITLRLTSSDEEGDAPWYTVRLPATPHIQANFNSATGEVVIQPDTGFVGRANLIVYVARGPLTDAQLQDSTLADSQVVSIDFSNPFSISIDPTVTLEKNGSATGTVTRQGVDISQSVTVTLTSSDPLRATVPASVTILADQTTATFAITPVDNALTEGTKQVTVTAEGLNFSSAATLSIFDDESVSPWQNAASPFDVNNDGTVAPLDVLLVINQIIRLGVRLLPIPQQAVTAFVDTDGDFFLSPIDVLRVINALNRRGSGEGEASTNSETIRASALSLWLTEESNTMKNRRSRG